MTFSPLACPAPPPACGTPPVSTPTTRGRAVCMVIAGLVVMTALGVGYGWSLFVPPLIRQYGWTHQQAQTVFGMLIAVYSLTMIGVGPLVSRWHPRRLTLISAVLFISGMALAAGSHGAYGPTLLAVGGLVGVGIGFGYVTVLSTCMAWFPKRQGAISGLVAAGFGGGPMVMTLALEPRFATGMDALQAFALLATVNGAALVLGALVLARAPQAPLPPSADPASLPTPNDGPVRQALSKPAFWTLFVGMLADTFAGFLLIGAIKPMGLAFGLSSAAAASGVLFLALGNCSGRFIWGLIADRLGARAIPLSLATLALAPLVLLGSDGRAGVFGLGAALIGFGFGAAFSVYPSQIAVRFGGARVATLYPLILVAQALSALAGPPTGGWLIDRWGHYDVLIALATLSALIGLAGVWILDTPLRRTRQGASPSR